MEAKLRYRSQLSSNGAAGCLYQEKKTKPIKKAKPVAPKPKPKEVEEEIVETPKPQPKPKPKPRIDFIQRNIDEAGETKSRAHVPKPQGKNIEPDHLPGEIPSYMDQVREELRSENHQPSGVKCPKGTRLMSEEERQLAIENLKAEKQEIETRLGKAPLHIESPQLLRNKKLLEQQLADIDQSLAQLSKKYIFVPI